MSFEKIDLDNNIRPKGKTCILIYGYSEKEIEIISKYAEKIGIKSIINVKDKIDLTLEELINNVKKDSLENNLEIDSKVIVLNAVSNKELNDFVHHFKTLNLGKPFFAMVTETSKKWKFKNLVNELKAEKEAFEKMKKSNRR